MPKLLVRKHELICPQDVILDVNEGDNLCEVLLKNEINIEHACEMSRACTTCHVVLRAGFKSVNAPEEDEEDLLDRAWGLEAESRLSCQVIVGKEDLEIEIPKYTINHARE